MTTKNKAAPGANRAASNTDDHGGDCNPPHPSRYRQKLNRLISVDQSGVLETLALLSAPFIREAA